MVMTTKTRCLILAVLFLLLGRAAAQTQENVGDIADGNRSVPVHLLKLYDEFDHVIKLDDRPVFPFSPKQTCRKCHDYEKIRRGWHFNAADSGVAAGRPGEPWIFVDRQAAIQIPLSYRRWKGTYLPNAMGLSSFKFLTTFGRHVPGGGGGENENAQELNDYMRWQVSGNLEVNCQSCHNGDPAQSQAEFGVQVLRQNFRWAAAASSGFATLQGSASEMPDNFDLYSSVPPEKSNFLPPTLTYNRPRFDRADRVLFNVPRKMSPSQCSFCHSSKVIDRVSRDRWESEEDVHIAAGMACVDCHRNGVDHMMVRGYEGEAYAAGRPAAATLTCRGCHIGNNDGRVPTEGRKGAPRPQHLGIPPVHFERLECTACHSGPWPSEITALVKTSRAHALGIPKADKADDALPHIVTPVFVQEPDGKYAPHHLVWPAFWAYRQGDTLVPIIPKLVSPLIAEIYKKDTTRVVGRWPVLSEEDVAGILRSLKALDSTAGLPVYVSAGKVMAIGVDGRMTRNLHDAAKPYAWPIAHDVRPKAQSLGIRGCADCHDTNAPFHLGSVTIASPFVVGADSVARMTQYQTKSAASAWLFSMSFLFRPWLKLLIILSFLVIASVVLAYAFRGIGTITRSLGEGEE